MLDPTFAPSLSTPDSQQGVLNFKHPSGTWVLNRQPPTKQLWLSSPRRCVCVVKLQVWYESEYMQASRSELTPPAPCSHRLPCLCLTRPDSGPKRFDYSHTVPSPEENMGTWVCTKEGQTYSLRDIMEAEFGELVGDSSFRIRGMYHDADR